VQTSAAKWLGTLRGLPGGSGVKLVLVLAVGCLVAADAASSDYNLRTAGGWLRQVLPWTPTLVLLAGPIIAAASWFVMYAVVLAMGAEPQMVSGTFFPTVIMVALCTYTLPRSLSGNSLTWGFVACRG
jgi:hypothetical protein